MCAKYTIVLSIQQAQIYISALLKDTFHFQINLISKHIYIPFKTEWTRKRRRERERQELWATTMKNSVFPGSPVTHWLPAVVWQAIKDASPQNINYFQLLSSCAQWHKNMAKSQCCPTQLNTKSYKPFLLSEATLCQQALKAQRMTPITKMYWPGSCRQTRIRKLATGRQTGSLFSSLFQDKYLISGTLMGIDWSLHPLFIDPSWLWSLLRWTHTHTYTQSCNPWMSNQNERLKA